MNQAATPGRWPGARIDALPEAVRGALKRDRDGLFAAVIQDVHSGEVLMVGWMNDEALRRTIAGGRVTFWSRSRQEYWRKGDTSGHYQYLHSLTLDCDGDALVARVEQVGAACHTGTRSCFAAGPDILATVSAALEAD